MVIPHRRVGVAAWAASVNQRIGFGRDGVEGDQCGVALAAAVELTVNVSRCECFVKSQYWPEPKKI